VDADREHPEIEWISAEFARRRDAEEHASNVGGNL